MLSEIEMIAKEFLLDCEIRGLSVKTIKNRKFEIGKFLDFLYTAGVKEISGVNRMVIKQYLAFKSSQNLSRSSIRAFYFCVSSFITFCEKERYLPKNIMEGLEPPKIEQRQVNALTYEEVIKLLNSYTTQSFKQLRGKTAIALLADTGVRSNELLNIKLDHIQQDSIFIEKAKGNKQRTVYLSALSTQILSKYLRRPQDYFTDHALIDEEYLFVSSTVGRQLTYAGLYQIIKFAEKKAGLKDVRPHKFRHFYAVQSLSNGLDLFFVQRVLGHKSVSTTAKVYLGSMQEAEVKRNAKLNSPLLKRNKK